MTPTDIGILHPGSMGVSVAVAAQLNGHVIHWASAGRSEATRTRAAQHALREAGSVAELCARCGLIVSVCPPHAAEAVAAEVAEQGYRGLFVEANAIAPERTRRIGAALVEAGASFVDGAIIGGPAWEPGRTLLYLSGPRAAEVAGCFPAGPLGTRILGTEIGPASALKMCYAAYSKGTTALLGAILATAESLEVRAALEAVWDQDDPTFSARAGQRVRRSSAKAWRFVGEMDEIAATFQAAGLPGEFHTAAAEVYRRQTAFKDATELPQLEVALAALRTPTPTPQP